MCCLTQIPFLLCLHINFGSSKEKRFEQLKVEGEKSVVGQVMAAGRNTCLIVN